MPPTAARRLAFPLLLAATAGAQALVPAGAINGALAVGDRTVLVEDDDAVVKSATAIRDRFFAGAPIVRGAPGQPLRGRDLLVYGTPKHSWVAAHAARLPFQFGERRVAIAGQTFTGEHLRVICALRNPDDTSSFGDTLVFTLPSSGLAFTLSYKQWQRPRPGRDPADRLQPDVPVPFTRQHLVADADPVLEHLRTRR